MRGTKKIFLLKKEKTTSSHSHLPHILNVHFSAGKQEELRNGARCVHCSYDIHVVEPEQRLFICEMCLHRLKEESKYLEACANAEQPSPALPESIIWGNFITSDIWVRLRTAEVRASSICITNMKKSFAGTTMMANNHFNGKFSAAFESIINVDMALIHTRTNWNKRVLRLHFPF